MSTELKIEFDGALLSDLPAAVRQQLGLAVEALAGDVRDEAKRLINNTEKTGRIYGAETDVAFTAGGADVAFTAHAGKKLGDDKVHQASAPGEAPANEHGDLAASIATKQVGDLSWEIVVSDDAALALEFGTQTAGRSKNVAIAPRPFLGPALESVRPTLEAVVASALKKASGG